MKIENKRQINKNDHSVCSKNKESKYVYMHIHILYVQYILYM